MTYLLSAALFFAGQSAPGSASIAGHVFHSVTGAPVRKAAVVLTAPNAPIRLRANTDAEGRFRFTGLPAGTYRLSASRAGFLDRPSRRPMKLGSNEQLTDADIRLTPQSVISGRVLDETGEPVDGARVRVFKQSYRNGHRVWDLLSTTSETNDTGEYRAPNLAPGRYILQAQNTRPETNNRYGDPPTTFYVPVYHPSALSEDQALPVSVGVAAEVRGIDMQLRKLSRPPSVRVRGRVIGMQPDSAATVSVSLFPANGRFFGGGNTTAAPPEYAFEMSTPPGQYTLFGRVYSGGPEAYGSAILTITGDVEGVVLAMNPGPVVVTGRISLAESDAKVNVQDVRVNLTRVSSSLVFEVRPDAAGKFAFPKPVFLGHYEVVNVRSMPEGCFIREMKIAGENVSWDEFEIAASTEMEIVLSNTAGKIAGSVSDADGKPFPGSSVTLIPSDGKSRPARQPVDEDGNFQFTGVRPGKYKLFTWEEVNDDVWQDPDFRKNYESRAIEITVGPREVQKAQLRVIPADAIK